MIALTKPSASFVPFFKHTTSIDMAYSPLFSKKWLWIDSSLNTFLNIYSAIHQSLRTVRKDIKEQEIELNKKIEIIEDIGIGFCIDMIDTAKKRCKPGHFKTAGRLC